METVHRCGDRKRRTRKMSSTQEEIFNCVLSGDLETLKQLLESEAVNGEAEDPFGKRDEAGRNALLSAAMLGRSAIIRELVGHGADVNEHTARGYSSLHLAACWGHLEAVRTLLELGAQTQTRTFRGETPVDLAHRYARTECAECVVLAEAKQDLVLYIDYVRSLVSDPERKLEKKEKDVCLRSCSAKSDWIQNTKNPTASDFREQRKDMEDSLQPILTKMSACSSESPTKAAGKL
ncbi:hypothetical protein LDENG_00172840 [Lucifuga dentata]|nr:hypothetical protein LDENG_00172840 [Lucifuga dentata]